MKDYFNNKCEVVRDLLPIYADKGCSEKTSLLIKEHLSLCPDCKRYLSAIKKSEKHVYYGDIQSPEPDYSALVSKMRKTKIIKRSVILSSVIIGLAAEAVIILSRHD